MFSAVFSLLLTANAAGYSTRHYCPEVRPNDLAEFGITHADAEALHKLAKEHIEHHDKYLFENYPVLPYTVWKSHAFKSREAWMLVESMTSVGITKERLPLFLTRLTRLREILGETDYESRRMPQPCPGWMFTD